MRRLLLILPPTLLIGVLGGTVLTLYLIAQARPDALGAARPPGGASDLTVIVDEELFEREANRRALSELSRYELRAPRWRLGKDNTITLQATGKVPVVGTEAEVRVVTRPVVRDGAVAVELQSISYGRIRVSGERLSGLVEDLNRQLADAIDRERFEVEDIRATDGALTVRLRVLSEL